MSKPAQIDYTSPFPECRVAATVDPFGMIRLDVCRDRAALIAKHVKNTLDAHYGEGLLDIHFQMSRRAYTHLSDNIGQILNTEADGVQVVLDPDPSISIMVILNRTQIQKLDESSDIAVQTPGDAFAWEVSVSDTGAEFLVHQLIAAVKGEDDPMDAAKDRMGAADE